MRFLTNFTNGEEAEKFSNFLSSEHIDSKVDQALDTDWGSADYGTTKYTVWVIEEDHFDKAYSLLEAYLADPNNPRFNVPPPIKAYPMHPVEEIRKSMPPLASTKSPITMYLIVLCTLIFTFESLSSPEYTFKDKAVPVAPLYTSPVKEKLLYDFPKAYELIGKLINEFGIDALKEKTAVPPQASALVNQINHSPFWQGYYDELVRFLQHAPPNPPAPWFEKIREGEYWRIFSPILLHGDIFHLLFNMIWLFVLGKQLEIHLKPLRYIIFILVTAAISNTAQYLIGGPNFLGFSGVLCAMLTFIWCRQQIAPWEGYQLQKSTFLFMMIFILGMFSLQAIFFLLEAFTKTPASTSIANGAHITGAILGIILAKSNFFTRDETV